MAAKEKIIEGWRSDIARLTQWIATMQNLELGRVYKWATRSGTWNPVTKQYDYKNDGENYGVLETFNTDSMRFRMLASTNTRLHDEVTTWGSGNNQTRYRHNIDQAGYSCTFERVKKSDLPMMLGLPYVAAEVSLIFNGTSRKKYKFD